MIKRVNLKKYFLLVFMFIIFIILFSPLYYCIRSYVIMYPYSLYEKYNSLLKKEKITMKIPGGLRTKYKDWYPFVLVYNADNGFSHYMGRDLLLTILYNFGSFNNKKGTSNIYNPKSNYYSSFYGGYLVKDKSSSTGFGFTKENDILIDEIIAIPRYDYESLVLGSFNVSQNEFIFEYNIIDIEYNCKYVGEDGFVKIDSYITTNGVAHKKVEKLPSYIQYGEPIINVKNDFKKVDLVARIYCKYIEEKNISVFLYIMTKDKVALEKCDEDILSKTILKY